MGQFKALNEKRKSGYRKNADDERFMLRMNEVLQELELSEYPDHPPPYPVIFVHGLPRSGTTLTSQVIAYSLDVGYINNLMARFWLAPVHGIRLSKDLWEAARPKAFESDYARTRSPNDIHEFGYFWRHWLKKETFADITQAKDREDAIDWPGLRSALAAMQLEFQKPLVFKNILGSYHMIRMHQEVGKVLNIHIQRDPLDVAVSILQARRKYYTDLNTWWSYVPPEYDQLKDLDYGDQIAGQVYYLQRFYANEGAKLPSGNLIQISYEALCRDPGDFLAQIQQRCLDLFGFEVEMITPPPDCFAFRSHADADKEKDRFRALLQRFDDRP